MHACLSIYVYDTYVCMHVCMYACMHVCMYACMHVCMYVCMYVCMHACICMYGCMHARTHACMHTCMYVCMYVCMIITWATSVLGDRPSSAVPLPTIWSARPQSPPGDRHTAPSSASSGRPGSAVCDRANKLHHQHHLVDQVQLSATGQINYIINIIWSTRFSCLRPGK